METKKRKGFLEGAYGIYFLPGVIFQSVIIGGAYATGREIFEFGGKFGAAGWYSTLAITIGFRWYVWLLLNFVEFLRPMIIEPGLSN